MEQPHSSNLRLHRSKDISGTFFVTKSLRPKKPVLERDLRAVIVAAFRFSVEHERIFLRAFVVMPDHWHALFALREPWTLPRFMHVMMSHVGARTASALIENITAWQDSYYETLIKTARQFGFVAHYIEMNPVKKEFVVRPEEWDATSARQSELVQEPWPEVFDEDF